MFGRTGRLIDFGEPLPEAKGDLRYSHRSKACASIHALVGGMHANRPEREVCVETHYVPATERSQPRHHTARNRHGDESNYIGPVFTIIAPPFGTGTDW
jgi:hypothetical protein